MNKKSRCLFSISIVLSITSSSTLSASTLPITNRIAISDAIAEKRSSMVMLIATKGGVSEEFEKQLKTYKAKIEYSDSTLGYYRVRAAIDHIISISSLSTVLASSLPYGPWHVLSPESDSELPPGHSQQLTSMSQYVQLANTDKRYDWREPMGLRSLWESSPELDGRGVTIAIIEKLPDLLSRNLQTARDANGRFVPKIVGVYSFHNQEPNDYSTTPSFWESESVVRLSVVHTDSSGAIHANGWTIQAPATGHFELGFLERFSDSSPSGAHRPIPVLRRLSAKCVWIDTNRNGKLDDEQCIGEFNTSREAGWMRNATGKAEGAPFYVISTQKHDVIRVAQGNYHTHAVAVAAAGNSFWDTELGGVAPNARLMILDTFGRDDEVIEAAIFAAQNKSVDIIVPMMGSTGAADHGLLVYNIVLDRLAELYDKVVLHPAGNGYRLYAGLAARASGNRTLSIAQFHSGRIASLLRGREYADAVPLHSSGGPTADGMLKPDLTASSSIVLDADYRRIPEGIQEASIARLCPGLSLDLPAQCFGGTSGATPSAAGAAAILINAARTKKLPYNEAKIRRALEATTHLTPEEFVYLQGRGLIHVPAAIEYLRKLGAKTPQSAIIFNGPADTFWSTVPPLSGRGRGLHETRGWHPGSRGVRHISVRRTNGIKRSQFFNLEVIGDQPGTFQIAPQVQLPLGEEVRIPIHIHTKSQGIHSAFLRITDPTTDTVLADIGLYVIASLPLRPENGYSAELKGIHSETKPLTLFLEVPAGLASLNITNPPLESATGELRVDARGPTGLPYDPEQWKRSEKRKIAIGTEMPEVWQRSFYRPAPGLWRIEVITQKIGASNKSYEISLKANGQPEGQIVEKTGEEEMKIITSSFPYSSNTGYSWKLVKGRRYHGTVSISPEHSPVMLPIKVPTESSVLEATVKIANNGVGQSVPVTVSAINCVANSCNVRQTNVGFFRTGIIAGIQPGERWQIAFDAGQMSAHQIDLEYEIFVKSTEPVSDDIALSLPDRGSLLSIGQDCDADANILAAEFFSARTLYSTYIDIPAQGDPAGSRSYLEFQTYVPLARDYLECLRERN